MSTELTNVEKIRGLPWLVARGAANSVFCYLTLFGPIFLLFLDELGLPKAKIGLLLSLLPFCGLLALLLARWVARLGLKRTQIIFWGLRKTIVAFLVLTPWVHSRFGAHVTFLFVAAIVLGFAICRAIAETASYPWGQEVVPDSIRGKFGAVFNLVSSVSTALALAVGSYVIGHFAGLNRFTVLIAAGVVFGFVALLCSFFVPGGAPIRADNTRRAHLAELLAAVRDRDFRFYLGGLGAALLAFSLLVFVPLFLKEQIGLDEGQVTRLPAWTLMSGVVVSFFWGWAADRYGSKPVMLSGLSVMALLPACWALMPRGSAWSNPAAIGLALLGGVGGSGWGIGSSRLLYVSVVPPEKKSEYMAVYYAWMGLVSGAGTLISGSVIDLCRGIEGKVLILRVGPYTPVFAASFALLMGAVLIARRVESERAMPASGFAAMFFRGNPLMAFESMVRFGLAADERSRVSVTERLGMARSPLNVDELLEALADPSFNVRYEAIVSIARTRPDRRLTGALMAVLEGNEPDLSPAAAWALGRIGDKRAIEPLRQALERGYPLLRARSARALATLGDTEVIPLLFARLRDERDEGLRNAYASALGALRVSGATGEILSLLRNASDETARMELAFAVARIIGHERMFIRLWRQMRTEAGTAASRAALSLKRKLARLYPERRDLAAALDECALALAREDLAGGAALAASLIAALPLEQLGEVRGVVLRECEQRLHEFGAARSEYLLLFLHTIATS